MGSGQVVRFGQAVFDAVLVTDAAPEEVPEGPAVFLSVRELDTIVGEHRVDLIGHDLDQATEEPNGRGSFLLLMQLGIGELRGAVYTDEEVEAAFFGARPQRYRRGSSQSGTF